MTPELSRSCSRDIIAVMAMKLITVRADEALIARFDAWVSATGRSRTGAIVEFMGRQSDRFEGKTAPAVAQRPPERRPRPEPDMQVEPRFKADKGTKK